ncbi:MAG: hypothetical protein ACE5KH_06540 [Candidatus Geothermarchaeales archaeon]
MGILKVDNIDLNDKKTIRVVRQTIQDLVSESSYFTLSFKPEYYFEVPNGTLPSEGGWYIILDSDVDPIYVGKADNLNKRLNTTNGSLDNFANKTRPSDPERNFIKKLAELGFMSRLGVCIITEKDLCRSLNLGRLSDVDRGNVEKFINIHRGSLSFRQTLD